MILPLWIEGVSTFICWNWSAKGDDVRPVETRTANELRDGHLGKKVSLTESREFISETLESSQRLFAQIDEHSRKCTSSPRLPDETVELDARGKCLGTTVQHVL
jgi:hypothetical protein